MLQLQDRIAVVTGASRGIGRAIGLALAEAGATVALLSRSEKRLREVSKEIIGQGGRASTHPCDIRERKGVESAFKDILAQHGTIHVLVNNAGVTRDHLILRMSSENWAAPLETNLTGAFYCIKASVRPMIRQRFGRIISITSVVGVMGNAGQTNYAASKAGLIGLTKSAAKELASRGITVNAVAPGYINTVLTAKLSGSMKNKLIEHIPLGRLGEPEDVAPAVVFLASDGARYITGQTLLVDGGMVI